MRRALVVVASALVLAGCAGGDPAPDVSASVDAALDVGVLAGQDAATMARVGDVLCDFIRERGAAGMASWVSLSQGEYELTRDEATRAAAALVVRYCPELAG